MADNDNIGPFPNTLFLPDVSTPAGPQSASSLMGDRSLLRQLLTGENLEGLLELGENPTQDEAQSAVDALMDRSTGILGDIQSRIRQLATEPVTPNLSEMGLNFFQRNQMRSRMAMDPTMFTRVRINEMNALANAYSVIASNLSTAIDNLQQSSENPVVAGLIEQSLKRRELEQDRQMRLDAMSRNIDELRALGVEVSPEAEQEAFRRIAEVPSETDITKSVAELHDSIADIAPYLDADNLPAQFQPYEKLIREKQREVAVDQTNKLAELINDPVKLRDEWDQVVRATENTIFTDAAQLTGVTGIPTGEEAFPTSAAFATSKPIPRTPELVRYAAEEAALTFYRSLESSGLDGTLGLRRVGKPDLAAWAAEYNATLDQASPALRSTLQEQRRSLLEQLREQAIKSGDEGVRGLMGGGQ